MLVYYLRNIRWSIPTITNSSSENTAIFFYCTANKGRNDILKQIVVPFGELCLKCWQQMSAIIWKFKLMWKLSVEHTLLA